MDLPSMILREVTLIIYKIQFAAQSVKEPRALHLHEHKWIEYDERVHSLP